MSSESDKRFRNAEYQFGYSVIPKDEGEVEIIFNVFSRHLNPHDYIQVGYFQIIMGLVKFLNKEGYVGLTNDHISIDYKDDVLSPCIEIIIEFRDDEKNVNRYIKRVLKFLRSL